MSTPHRSVTIADGVIMKSTSLRAQVEGAISAAIVSGELAPGTVVSVPSLAAQFNVSATPVREAILHLETRGFVVALRNKGFRVTDVDDEALAQIVEVRRMLEPEAMYRLAPVFDSRKSPAARKLADRIVTGAAEEDLNAYLAADREFHLSLIAMLGNPVLVGIVADLRERTRLVGLRSMLRTNELTLSASEHHGLLDLLEARDADGVRSLMQRHIGHIVGWWSGHPEGR